MTEGQGRFSIQDSQTVVFIGDSITDCSRRDVAYPYGEGYVRFAIDLITARYPQRDIKYVNRGISGDVSLGLQRRWKKDVLTHKPDWVSVLIGINDLHQCFYQDMKDISPRQCRQAYLDCLSRTVENTQAKLVLMDPFYICNDPQSGSAETFILSQLPGYIAVVEEMAEKFDAIHVPLHDVFQKQLGHRPADMFCPEPVHPNATGHMIIAHAWLNAMGW